IIKMAMIDVDHWLETEQPAARLVMQVHDELVLEVDTDWVDDIARQVAHRMSSVAELDVPLLAEAGSGDNWDEAH
ncbi:MAG TPA: DNA polymerase I, partial [Gammaproteobacteria bacterium]|nr:DNA polymerase I [Gammaproteobacteria bacterium]